MKILTEIAILHSKFIPKIKKRTKWSLHWEPIPKRRILKENSKVSKIFTQKLISSFKDKKNHQRNHSNSLAPSALISSGIQSWHLVAMLSVSDVWINHCYFHQIAQSAGVLFVEFHNLAARLWVRLSRDGFQTTQSQNFSKIIKKLHRITQIGLIGERSKKKISKLARKLMLGIRNSYGVRLRLRKYTSAKGA